MSRVTVRFEPVTAAALARLQLRMRENAWDMHGAEFDATTAAALEAMPNQWCAIIDGQICAAGGIVVPLPGRAAAWLAVGRVPRRAWPVIVRKCVAVLNVAIDRDRLWRIEATVATGHPAAVAFAERFGFAIEGLQRCGLPDGTDAIVLARVERARIPALQQRAA